MQLRVEDIMTWLTFIHKDCFAKLELDFGWLLKICGMCLYYQMLKCSNYQDYVTITLLFSPDISSLASCCKWADYESLGILMSMKTLSLYWLSLHLTLFRTALFRFFWTLSIMTVSSPNHWLQKNEGLSGQKTQMGNFGGIFFFH